MSKECRYIDHEYLCEKGELDTEIAYLRAEVERLTHNEKETRREEEVAVLEANKLRRERDEALARIKTLEATLNNIPCSGPAGCEALSQGAVLLKAAEAHLDATALEGPIQTGSWIGLQIALTKLSHEARALLDRLRLAEGNVEESHEMINGLLDRLQRAEAVVEEMKQLLHEAAYLIQFQHDNDAAARGWSDKYYGKRVAWEEGEAG